MHTVAYLQTQQNLDAIRKHVEHVNASINALIYSFNQSGYAIIETILEIFPTHIEPWGRARWMVCVFKPTSGAGALPSILNAYRH